MRDIEFRGKRIDNGEWVYGYLSSFRTIAVTSPPGNYDEYVIDPATVGQYTGLTDKNGKKIFEGDIVKIDTKGWYYPAGNGTFVWKDWIEDITAQNRNWMKQKAGWALKSDCTQIWDHTSIEVIGNIHDTPDWRSL